MSSTRNFKFSKRDKRKEKSDTQDVCGLGWALVFWLLLKVIILFFFSAEKLHFWLKLCTEKPPIFDQVWRPSVRIKWRASIKYSPDMYQFDISVTFLKWLIQEWSPWLTGKWQRDTREDGFTKESNKKGKCYTVSTVCFIRKIRLTMTHYGKDLLGYGAKRL